jgi:hypothetical protein
MLCRTGASRMLTPEAPREEASEACGTARAGEREVTKKEARSEAALRTHGERAADADPLPVEGRALDRGAEEESPLGLGRARGPEQGELRETALGCTATGTRDRLETARDGGGECDAPGDRQVEPNAGEHLPGVGHTRFDITWSRKAADPEEGEDSWPPRFGRLRPASRRRSALESQHHEGNDRTSSHRERLLGSCGTTSRFT